MSRAPETHVAHYSCTSVLHSAHTHGRNGAWGKRPAEVGGKSPTSVYAWAMVWVSEWVLAILFQGKSSQQADIKMTTHSVQQAAQSENINGLLGSVKQPNQLVSVLKGKSLEDWI